MPTTKPKKSKTDILMRRLSKNLNLYARYVSVLSVVAFFTLIMILFCQV